jgi:hypothetical protein
MKILNTSVAQLFIVSNCGSYDTECDSVFSLIKQEILLFKTLIWRDIYY